MALFDTETLMNEISWQWYKQPDGNYYKLMDIFTSNINAVDDLAQKVADWRDIGNAQGAILDMLGQNYNVKRVSDDDDFYRFMIRSQQIASRANGTADDILSLITRTLDVNPNNIHLTRTAEPNHIRISLPYSNMLKDPVRLQLTLSMLSNATMAGIWLDNVLFNDSTAGKLYVGAYSTNIEHHVLK